MKSRKARIRIRKREAALKSANRVQRRSHKAAMASHWFWGKSAAWRKAYLAAHPNSRLGKVKGPPKPKPIRNSLLERLIMPSNLLNR